MTFDEWWNKTIEQNVTSDRAKRFAKAAWDAAKEDLKQEVEKVSDNDLGYDLKEGYGW